jgi:hypothetical protein
MQLKIYVPTTIEIPSEYLPALAKRAFDSLGANGDDTRATRGHLVRQAVLDGLLRELDALRISDDVVDVYCDPQGELPLEIDNHSLTLPELIEALQAPKPQAPGKRNEAIDGLRGKEERVLPMRRAA